MPKHHLLMYLFYEKYIHTGQKLQTKKVAIMPCTIAHLTGSDLHNHLLVRLKETAVCEWGYISDGNVLQSVYGNDQIGYEKLDSVLFALPKPFKPTRRGTNFLKLRNKQCTQ